MAACHGVNGQELPRGLQVTATTQGDQRAQGLATDCLVVATALSWHGRRDSGSSLGLVVSQVRRALTD